MVTERVRELRLKLVQSEKTQRVFPTDLLDYQTFSQRYARNANSTELQVFGRFQAANSLIRDGFDAYLDPLLVDPEDDSVIQVDTCGAKQDSLMLVFCETGTVGPSLAEFLDKVDKSQNARAIVLAPLGSSARILETDHPSLFASGKIRLESLGWFGGHLDETLQQTLKLIDLLGNETRMRMLAPLFRKASGKREYRSMINPKLVYQNLSMLQQAGIVDELEEGTYELSVLGKTVMAEFIAFLEKTRRTLDSVSKQKEVKLNG